MKKMCCVFALFYALFCMNIFADIVSETVVNETTPKTAEKEKPADEVEKKKDEPKVKFKGAFGLDFAQGNTEALGVNIDFGLSVSLQKTAELVFSASGSYLETDGEKKADSI